MPDNVDLAFRPRSYWTLSPRNDRPPVSDGANRPGVAPGFGDGGYLPDLGDDEVDIALISLESTTGDVIAFRATPVADGIRYSVVDEYDNAFEVDRPVRPGPLTLGQIIELIDTVEGPDGMVGLVEERLEFNLVDDDSDPDDLRDFIEVSSLFYPQLAGYYDERIAAWVEAVRERQGR